MYVATSSHVAPVVATCTSLLPGAGGAAHARSVSGLGDHEQMNDPATAPPFPPPARRPSPLTRWRQLPADERALALRLLWLLPLIDLSLRSAGFQRSRGWLSRFLPSEGVLLDVSPESLADAQRLAWLARAVGARSPWRTSCLRQALAVWLLLRRRRLPAELKIGVVRRAPPFQAHAWVELAGVALDPAAAEHAAFPGLPPTP